MLPRQRRSSEWAARGVGLVGVVVALGGVLCARPISQERAQLDDEPPADALVIESFTATAEVDAGPPVTLARPVPDKPIKGQKRAPCDTAGAPPEEEIAGGCWYRLAFPAPCGSAYESGGRCYYPVVAPARAPTSAQP